LTIGCETDRSRWQTVVNTLHISHLIRSKAVLAVIIRNVREECVRRSVLLFVGQFAQLVESFVE
jgi:hypothetical protein